MNAQMIPPGQKVEPYRSTIAKLYDDHKLGEAGLSYNGRITEHLNQSPFDTGMAAWAQNGKQSFLLAPALVDLLDDTDLHGAPTDAIQLPYNAFYMEPLPDLFPEAEREALRVAMLRGELHDARHNAPLGALIVHENIAADAKFRFITGKPKPGLFAAPKLNAFATDPREEGKERRQVWAFFMRRYGDNFLFTTRLQFWLLPGKTVEESINVFLAECKIKERSNIVDVWDGKPAVDDFISDESSKRAIAFIANFVLYCSTPDPDLRRALPPQVKVQLDQPTKNASHQRAKEALERKHGYWTAGAALTYYKESRGPKPPPGDPTGVKRRRHWVRCHWHTFRCGPLRQQVRVRLVMSHWRGSVDPGQAERTYVARAGDAQVPAAANPAPPESSQDKHAAGLREEIAKAKARNVCRGCGDRTHYGSSHEEREELAYCSACFRDISKKTQETELWALRGRR